MQTLPLDNDLDILIVIILDVYFVGPVGLIYYYARRIRIVVVIMIRGLLDDMPVHSLVIFTAPFPIESVMPRQ